MGVNIVLKEDFEGMKEGTVITVTQRKLIQMTKDNIKFNPRLSAITSVRQYVYEQPIAAEEEE